MNLEALRNRRLTDLRNRMDDTDRQLRRDAEIGHGPALDAWKRCRDQAAAALDQMLPKGGEGGAS